MDDLRDSYRERAPSVLPDPVSVTFRNINLRTGAPTNKHILKDVFGRVSSGEVMACLGPSGSGKTSLINVLAGRIGPEYQYEGEVLFNGNALHPEEMTHFVSYVLQDDALLGNLTVKETLEFAALLQLPASVPLKTRLAKVEDVILELRLLGCQDTCIGTEFRRGISGGEKRRVSVGVQLLKGPSVVFLDEPTSGLDTATAHGIVVALRQLAARNRSVVCTIHQPRSDMFELFDVILVLSCGEVMFYGRQSDLVAHMDRIQMPCPSYANPLDHIIDLCAVNSSTRAAEGESYVRIKRLRDAMAAETPKWVSSELEKGYLCREGHARSERSTTRFFRKFHLLVRRLNLNNWRDLHGIFNKLLQMAFFGLVLVMFIGKLDHDQTSIQNRTGLFIETALPTPTVGLMSAIATYPAIRNTIHRELRDGQYTVSEFVAALAVTEVPLYIVAGALFSLLVHTICGLNGGFDHFLVHAGVSGLLLVYGQALGIAFLTFIEDPFAASNAATALLCVLGFTSTGFLRSVYSMPTVYYYMSWAAITKYGSELYAINEYTDCWDEGCPVEFSCRDDELCVYEDGDEYLDEFFPGIYDRLYLNIAMTVALSVLSIVAIQVALTGMLHWERISYTLRHRVGMRQAGKSKYERLDNTSLQEDVPPNPVFSSRGSDANDANGDKLAARGGKPCLVDVVDDDIEDEAEAVLPPVRPITIKFCNIRVALKSVPSFFAPRPSKERRHTGGKEKLLEANSEDTTGGAEEGKVLLDGVSGCVQAGQMLAILGGSGSGKTTLLNVLSDRSEESLAVSGSVSYNNKNASSSIVSHYSGYVEQQDALLEYLTVWETLYFAGKLYLKGATDATVRRKVEMIISEFGLRRCADTRLGGVSVRGVSGGEKRRVSVGMQLLKNPSVLYLDEPTTGLDSFTACTLITFLSSLAARKRTIVCTIHQPRSSMFELFDQILVLSAGKIVYMGSRSDLIPHMDSIGYPCPNFSNPLDFVIDISVVDYRSRKAEAESKERVRYFASLAAAAAEETDKDCRPPGDPEAYKWDSLSEEGSQNSDKWDIIPIDAPSPVLRRISLLSVVSSNHGNNSMEALSIEGNTFMTVLRRQWLDKSRNRGVWITWALQFIIVGFVTGTVYWQLGDDIEGSTDRLSLCYLTASLLPFLVLLTVVSAVNRKRPMYFREHRDGLYSPLSFYVASIIAETPFFTIFSVLFSASVYFPAGFQTTAGNFSAFTLFVWEMVAASYAMAHMCAWLVIEMPVALIFANIIFTLALIPSGFVVNVESIPDWLMWLSDSSYLRHGMEALSQIEFTGLEFCTFEFRGECVATVSGDDMLDVYSMKDHTVTLAAIVIGVVVVGFHFFGLLAITFVNQRPRT